MYTEFAAALCWFIVGSMLFFGAIVAPVVFTTLEPDDAGRFLRTLFPRLYLFCGVVTAMPAVLLAMDQDVYPAAALAVVSILFFVARGPLTQSINNARDAELIGEPGAKKRFDRLHKLSTRIFGLQFLVILGIALMWGPLN